jgi:Flp pilus assembly protein TadD
MAEEARLSSTYTGPAAPFFAPPLPQSDPVEVGNRLLAAGEPEMALRRFEEALLANPRSADALVGVAAANHRMGRLAQARRFLEFAVEVAPDSVAAWNNLGVVRYGMADYPGARDALRTAFALDGGQSDDIRTNLALVEHLLPQPIDADSVVTEFEMQRTGDGTYRLVDRRKPPEG